MGVYPDNPARNGFGATALAGNARSMGWRDERGWHELGLSARRMLDDVTPPIDLPVRGGAVLRIVEQRRRRAVQDAVQAGDLLAGVR